MKKNLLILICIVFNFSGMTGQTTIRGTVTNSADGIPVQGVKVSTGGILPSLSLTGSKGQYLVFLHGNPDKLKFSKNGYKSKVVHVSGSFIDVSLVEIRPKSFLKNIQNSQNNLSGSKSDSIQVESVEKGYGLTENLFTSTSIIQVVSDPLLNNSYQSNINNILAGKVPGLKIYGQSDMALGRTGTVGLRGQGGLSTGQSPVYIIDGTYISNTDDINYNEIESVSILYGPASSAILGSVAANGAVLITTRKGESQVGKSGVEINSGIMFSKVYITPKYQNSYAGGNADNMQQYTYRPGIDPVEWQPLDGKYYHDYGDDSSWGPEMVGQEYIPWYSWYPGTKYTATTAKLVPQPDNVQDFYNTGIRINNSFAFSKSSDNFSIRAVLGNSDIKGVIPFTSLKKNSFALKTKYEPVERLTIEADINFFTTLQEGEISDSFSNATTGSFNSWFQRDLDMHVLRELTDLRTPQGFLASWNHNNPVSYDPASPLQFYGGNYWINPYKYLKSKSVADRTDRLYGNLSVSYKLAKSLMAQVIYRRQENTGWSETKVPILQYSGLQSIYRSDYYYSTGSNYFNEEHLTAFFILKRVIKDFHVDLAGGSEFSEILIKTNSARTTDGMNIPDLYTIQNSRGTPIITNTRTVEKTRSIFVHSIVGYRSFLFLDITLRKEWLSTLPPNHNSINVRSFGGFFVFSELINLPFLSSGRVLYSWGETPTGLNVYQYPGSNYVYKYNNYSYYDKLPYLAWNGIYLMETQDNLVKPDIRGAVKRQSELGIEMELFKSRAGISLIYWKGKEDGIQQNIQMPGYSGFTTRLINSGRIEKSGLDLTLRFTSLSTENLSLQTNFVFSKIINQRIVNIGENITKISTQTFWSSISPSLTMTTGRQWGELYGSGKKTINGKPVLDATGHYVADPDKYFGSVIPDITGGFQNDIQIYKDFSINIGIDYQFGGKFFSLSDMWGTFSGLTARTAGHNDKGNPVRDPVAEGGGIHVSGVDATGKDVDYYLEAQDYFHSLYNYPSRVFDDFIYSSSYIKLREFSLSYRIPLKKIKTEKFNPDVTISIYTQNLCMIYAAQKKFDPSELTYISGEQAQFPSVRSFGTNLKINF